MVRSPSPHLLTRRPMAGALVLIAALLALFTVALFTAGSAHAQEPTTTVEPVVISAPAVEPGQITVTGRATATVANDQAIISLTVSALRDTALEAIVDVNATLQ